MFETLTFLTVNVCEDLARPQRYCGNCGNVSRKSAPPGHLSSLPAKYAAGNNQHSTAFSSIMEVLVVVKPTDESPSEKCPQK